MFPLLIKTKPTDSGELESALVAGIRTLVSPDKSGPLVELQGDVCGEVARLEVNLDNARLDTGSRQSLPRMTPECSAAFTATEFSVHALPLRAYETEIRFELSARDVNFEYIADKQGDYWLVPSADSTATNGRVAASVNQKDLTALLLGVAGPFAAEKGITITDAKVTVRSTGQRSVQAIIEATGKKFGMKARVLAEGRVDVDDELVATVSDLKASGEGFLGGTVSSLMQPKLNQINGSRIPLAALSLGGLKLRDLRIDVTDLILVQAEFGRG